MKRWIRRRTRIDIETHEITVVRVKEIDEKQFCERCSAELAELPAAPSPVAARQIEFGPESPVS